MHRPSRMTLLACCASLLYALYVQLVGLPWYHLLPAAPVLCLTVLYLECFRPRSKEKDTVTVKVGGQAKSGTRSKKAKKNAAATSAAAAPTAESDSSLPEEAKPGPVAATCELYVSDKGGNDEDGDGSEQKPFKTALRALCIAKETVPTIYVDSQKAGERWALISKNQMKNANKAWNRQLLTLAAKDKKEAEDNACKGGDLQEAKEMVVEKDGVLESNTDKIHHMVSGIQARLSATESLAGDNFSKMAAAEKTIKYLQEQNDTKLVNKTVSYLHEQNAAKLALAEENIKYLLEQNKYLQEQNALMNDRCDQLENRSRKSNLLLVNVPEDSEHGQSTIRFVSNLLMDIMGREVFDKAPELDRAHRAVNHRPQVGQAPRPIVVAFHWLQEKERARQWAQTHEMRYRGCTLRLYPDLCLGTAKKRAAFKPVKQLLYDRGIQFKLLYPARLKVMYKNDTFMFATPEEAHAFCDGLSDISVQHSDEQSWRKRNFQFINNPQSAYFNTSM